MHQMARPRISSNWRIALAHRFMIMHTRERIEQAALELFVAKGVAETSIREISATADVSQGAMYTYFRSKAELARSLFLQNFLVGAEALEAKARAETTLSAKLRSMVRYIYGRFDTDPEIVAYLYLSRQQYLRSLPEAFPHPYEAFRRVIHQAMQDGEIPSDDDHVATSMVVGAISQLIDTKIAGPIKGRLLARSDTVASSCLAMLKAAQLRPNERRETSRHPN